MAKIFEGELLTFGQSVDSKNYFIFYFLQLFSCCSSSTGTSVVCFFYIFFCAIFFCRISIYLHNRHPLWLPKIVLRQSFQIWQQLMCLYCFSLYLLLYWTSFTSIESQWIAIYKDGLNYECRRLARYTNDRMCQMCLWFSVEWTRVKCLLCVYMRFSNSLWLSEPFFVDSVHFVFTHTHTKQS